MKTRIGIIASLCALSTLTGMAQGGNFTIEGKLMGLSYFDLGSMQQLSNRNYAYGTARSSAMAGAFTSLGGDLSSMSINPAGLGMYRSSEFGISMGLEANSTHESYPGSLYREAYNSTRFVPTNVGVALNLYQGTGALTSFTFGFGYNRTADFNYRSTVGLPKDNYSIGQIFVRQLNDAAIPESAMKDSGKPFSYAPDLWGAILSYKTSVVNPSDVGTNQYDLTGMNPFNPFGNVNGLPLTVVDHLMQSKTKGSIGEYSIAGGFNFSNKVYFGFDFGIQDIYYQQTDVYSEYYENDKTIPDYGNYLSDLYYGQSVKMSGTAFNVKLGLIVRPTDALRIGVAFHSPSFVSLDHEYSADMQTDFNDNSNGYRESDLLRYNYRFSTPPRLLTGISYTFGSVGVISADYERVWYNGMRISDKDGWKDDFKNAAKDIYRGSDNIRVGAEFKPLPQLALRLGYAYYGSPLRDNDRVFDQPLQQQSNNISAGLGYRFGASSLDLAYTHMNEKFSSYDLYYYHEDTMLPDVAVSQSGYLTPERTRNLVSLSYSVRF